MSLEFSFAVAADSAAIADLVNSAYRGDSSRAGWTTEAITLRTELIEYYKRRGFRVFTDGLSSQGFA